MEAKDEGVWGNELSARKMRLSYSLQKLEISDILTVPRLELATVSAAHLLRAPRLRSVDCLLTFPYGLIKQIFPS